jgi:hypothetical protein
MKLRTTMSSAVLAALALALLTIRVTPALADSWSDCTQLQGVDRVIRGCTDVIANGHETNQKLVFAYRQRCAAYGDKDGYDEALADCSKILDANGQSLTYVYGHAYERDAQVAKSLTEDEARRISSNIAKLPNLLGKA